MLYWSEESCRLWVNRKWWDEEEMSNPLEMVPEN